MRKPFIAGNWKMNLTDEEALKFVDQVVERVPSIESVDYAVCGQAVSLKDMKERAVGTNLQIGAQNVHEEEKGAFTGEISASALTSVGVKLAIIGHSERREYYNDTDERINLKVKTALNHGITPILCVGEQLEEREAGRAESVVRKQLEDALDGIEAGRAADIVIAYEPVWAIGTGKSSSPEDAGAMCGTIRRFLFDTYGPETAESIRIQYGGSVKPENIRSYMAEEDIDGALVGGASLDVDSYLSLIEETAK
ncbi:triose-phosphate isomerase [Geomicrobium sp. JSM 1781026]|uniref:triose-phosphate isomerase n=1 Tax=Geomicrobium sp. JSM 1781026 TaxID=3344580 RepID=UPI0035BFA62F